ncbi:MAG TPA: hypothetical protein VFY24_01350 [Azospira sp.]|nr:hypothetical protein [Azospira sp.]
MAIHLLQLVFGGIFKGFTGTILRPRQAGLKPQRSAPTAPDDGFGESATRQCDEVENPEPPIVTGTKMRSMPQGPSRGFLA